ncbi:MAG: T9SS type A sorting domain-containing protein [bacterium]
MAEVMKIHLNNAILKVRLWNGTDSTGKVILQAPQIHIHSSSMIQGNGYGYLGGTNTHPNGYGQAGINGGAGGGRLTLRETGNDTISIYDVFGRVVEKILKTGHSNYIDLSMLQDGVYFIKTSDSCALNKVILIR